MATMTATVISCYRAPNGRHYRIAIDYTARYAPDAISVVLSGLTILDPLPLLGAQVTWPTRRRRRRRGL